MASEAAVAQHPGVRPGERGFWRSAFRRLRLLPPIPAPGPIPLNRANVSWLLSLEVVAVALAVFSFSLAQEQHSDFGSLLLGLTVIALMNAYSVRYEATSNTPWAADDLVRLGLAYVYGPIACMASAVVGQAALGLQQSRGWYRPVHNIAINFLSQLAAWAVFRALGGSASVTLETAFAGLMGGLALYAVQNLLIGLSIKIIFEGEMWEYLKSTVLELDPLFAVGYGWAALAVVALHPLHMLGMTLVTMPVLLLQGFLVVLARRVHVHDEENRLHQEARERLLQQAIDASNDEREKIAADIHDGVVQDLTGLGLTLSSYVASGLNSALDPGVKAELAEILNESANTARAAARDLRTLMIEIAPPKLKELGLRIALQDLLKHTGPSLKGQLEMDKSLDDLAAGQQRLIYRVAQEAMRNCLKYAEAKNLTVSITESDSVVTLAVSDDGKGFSTEQRRKRQAEGHVGLGLLARTVADGGGTLEIESEPGRGTTVTMRVNRAKAEAG